MKKIITILAIFVTLSSYAQTTLPTAWSFVNPSPTGSTSSNPTGPEYPGPTGWSTKLDISVLGFTYASGQDGNAACRLDQTGEYVKIWFTDKPGALSYYIKGTGISPAPAFAGTFKTQESADGNTWTDLRTFTAADLTNAFASITDNPKSTSRYIRFFYLDKQSGSNVSLDNVTLASAPASPLATINVKLAGADVVNGSTALIGKTASTQFTIENKGTLDTLFITGMNFTGAAAADFSVSAAPAYVLANSSATFNVNFSTTSIGSRKATLAISNSDTEKNPFNIKLYGIGGNLATEPTEKINNITFGGVKAYTYSVNIFPPANKSDKYLVLRKNGAAVTEVPVDGQTYSKGDNIGDAQVAYVGADTTFKPTYVLANSVYHYAVFPFNGPAGFENYLITSPMTGVVTTTGSNAGSYYASLDPRKASFLTELSAKINTHDTIFYSNYTTTLINNWLAKDTTGGKKVVYCVYTNMPYVYSEPFVWWNASSSTGTLTREHTFAQSWMPSNMDPNTWPQAPNGKDFPEYNDQHHLFPTDQINANLTRSNNAFGEVVTLTSTSPSGYGKLGKDANNKTVWEPRDEHKGDLARALFYMATCYNGAYSQNWGLSGGKFAQDTAVLMKWHRQDPPSELEIARHEYISSIQKNRNPFIDNPLWVYGINFTNMTYMPGIINGVNELNTDFARIYTNQETSEIVVQLDNTSKAKVTVTDMLGRVLSEGTTSSDKYAVNMSQKGVYVVLVENENKSIVKKVMLY